MSYSIPFIPSDTNYVLAVPIDDTQVLFDVRWNSREEAFYLDMYESDDTVIALNVKVVVGIPLGRRSLHTFFDNHIITAVDLSGEGRDPGFDDLGSRVIVTVQSSSDLA